MPLPPPPQIYSTNFRRTQRSAQAFLSGFKPLDLIGLGDGSDSLSVVVRHEDQCTLHMYDNDPVAIKEEVKLLMSSEQFTRVTAEYKDTENDLVRLVPGLKSSPFRWMEAADFFWCRSGSGLAMSSELQELAEPTIRCLTKRFALYYGHKPLLKLVIGPFVQELLQTLRSVTTGAATRPELSSMAVYSGHDVTILAMLFALESSLVKDADERAVWWPPYACSLVFEVLGPEGQAPWENEEEVGVRILMTGSGLGDQVFVPVIEGDGYISLAELARRLSDFL